MKPARRLLTVLLAAAGLQTVPAQTDVALIQSLGLPVLQVMTIDNEEPACDYVFAPPGEFGISTANKTKVPGRTILTENGQTLFDSGDYLKDTSGMTIRIRGNTSAYYSSKKPYKIKLEAKHDMLGRGDSCYYDKNWMLVDSGGDELNVLIGLKINDILGLGNWTPAYKFVNLIVNGDYRGIYMLLETVRRNKDCRLNVDKQTGYIIECDPYWWNEDVYFATDADKKFTFKYPDPDDVTADQTAYISQAVNRMEQAITAGDYPEYIDVSSFAGWLLAHDILGTYDSAGSNIYLTKYDDQPGSKLTMSTLWDFGSIMKTGDDWARVHSDYFYFQQLFSSQNTSFTLSYKQLWDRLSDGIFSQIETFLDDFAASPAATALEASRVCDQQRWQYAASTVDENILEAKSWFSSRKAWLARAISRIDPATGTAALRKDPLHTRMYKLNGQQLSTATARKGLYVHDGKLQFSSTPASAR